MEVVGDDDGPVEPRRIRLATVDDVRVEMARVYRDMRGGKLDPTVGGKFVWALAMLAKVTEASTFERRLQDLEDKQRRIGNDSQPTGSAGTTGATGRDH